MTDREIRSTVTKTLMARVTAIALDPAWILPFPRVSVGNFCPTFIGDKRYRFVGKSLESPVSEHVIRTHNRAIGPTERRWLDHQRGDVLRRTINSGLPVAPFGAVTTKGQSSDCPALRGRIDVLVKLLSRSRKTFLSNASTTCRAVPVSVKKEATC